MKRPNGTGSVYKDKRSGRYVGVAHLGTDMYGKPIRKKKSFDTKKEALYYIAHAEQEHPVARISTLWKTYECTKYLDLSEEKQRHYRTVCERLKPIWNKDINTLTILDLQRLIEPYNSYYAQKDIKTVLSHLYNIAIAQGLCTINLTPYMRLVEHQEKKGEPWTSEELDLFWQAYENGDRFCGYILLMCYTGMMPAEIREVRRDNIDYDNHVITGVGLKTAERKKSPIILSDRIIPVLQDLMQDSLVLWPYKKHTFYDHYDACILRFGGKVRRLPPYSCRHTAGTLLANTTSPLLVQKMMRHANITTTQRYVHPDYEPLIAASNKI